MCANTKSSIDQIQGEFKLRSLSHRFFDSAVLFALVELEVFQALSDGPLSLTELSRRLKVDPSRLDRLLRAASGLRLLEIGKSQVYQLPEAIVPFLAGERTLLPWIRFIRSISPRLWELSEAVRVEPEEAADEDYCIHGADLDAFSQAMHVYASTLGSELPKFLDLSQAHSLLDLACGSGTYAFLLGREYPHLSLGLMDASNVLELARKNQREMQITNAVQYLPGDVLVDPIPNGYEVILISNLLHLIGPSLSRKLLQRCFEALEPEGWLAVQAQFLGEGESRGWPAMLDLILLTGSPAGRNHTPSETMGWLEEAGFSAVEFEPMSLTNVHSLVRGCKPGNIPA